MMTKKYSKVGHSDLVLVCDHGHVKSACTDNECLC